MKNMRAIVSAVALLAAAAWSKADVTSGLAAHYKFDGDLTDSSGNGLHLSPDGTFQFVADRTGAGQKAVQLISAAPNGTFFLGTGPNLANRSSSVTFWVRKNYVGNGVNGSWVFGLGHPAGVGGQAGKDMHVALDYGESVRYSFFFDDFGISTSLPNFDWAHIGCTFDLSTMTRRIYVNGVEVASHGSAYGFSGGTALKMGYNGIALDDFRFYDRALSGAEMAEVAAISSCSVMEEQLAALQAQVASLVAEVSALEELNAMLEAEITTLLETLAQLAASNQQAANGLEEIMRLLRLPPGKRNSTLRFDGPLGAKINAIIEALIAPPGKTQGR